MILAKNQSNAAATDRLPPCLPATPRRQRSRVTAFAGLHSGSSEKWSISEMKNLSPRCAPALATRRPRELLAPARGSGTPHGVAVMEGDLYFVQGSTLYRISDALASAAAGAHVETVGTLTDTDKHMTVFGERLLIFPDKMYVDAADGVLRPMELDLGIVDGVMFSGSMITLPSGMTWKNQGFHSGDSVYVIDADPVSPAPEGYYHIKSVRGSVATVDAIFATSAASAAQICRRVPDMDATAVCGNRLFGYKGKNIYICAEGESLAWQGKQSDGLGPATLHTSSEGSITACAQWQGYMVFFKETRIGRVLGNSVQNYTLTEMAEPGIPTELSRTLCEVGGDLYYHGDGGVYRYASSTQRPVCVGRPLSDHPVGGCGSTDGDVYYLDAITERGGEAVHGRYLYLPETNEWYAEDAVEVCDCVAIEGYLCTQDSLGRLWLSRPDGRRLGCVLNEWSLWGNLYAYVTFSPDYTEEPDGYRPIALYIRATSAENAELRVLASFANGRAKQDAVRPVPTGGTDFADVSDGVVELATLSGKMSDRLVRIPLPGMHCDHMILSLEMRGEWEIAALVTEYEVVKK